MNPTDVATRTLERLQDAWNRADGTAYGAEFAPDAEFVDIRGELHRGLPAITGGHQWIFDNIYKGSRMRYELVGARAVTPEVVLAHSVGILDTPSGMFEGRYAINTIIMARQGETWRITAFHNALADKATARPR